jgi:pimeloyl-ACP methyl ester carboxylesterase
LRVAGHDVFTPTLTGLGERAHLASPDVSPETHIGDVLGVLDYEDLSGVNLVGHSASGAVISGVADLARNRVGQLIYLDAVVPDDGQSALESFGPRDRDWLKKLIAGSEPKWSLAVPAEVLGDDHPFGIVDPVDVRWMKSKLTPQPIRPWTDAVHLSGPIGSMRSYVYCDWRGNSYSVTAARVRSDPTWQYRELKTGHDAMVSAPRELADVLIELAAG